MKRYNAVLQVCDENTGDIVYKSADVYTVGDALAAVSSARADALRWVLARMEYNPTHVHGGTCCCRECSGIVEYRARLRAIIEKELEK